MGVPMSAPSSDHLPACPRGFLPGAALTSSFSPDLLAGWLDDARRRTLDLVADLTDEQLIGPRLDTVNPLLWELGHLAWFTEKWVLRRAGQGPLRPDADALYDSSAVAHATRWDLPLPSREDTLAYLEGVARRVRDRLDRPPRREEGYFVLLSIFHEDMHGEAFAYTRQTLGYPAPRLGVPAAGETSPGGGCPGDVSVPGGRFLLGSLPGEPFVFDNEKWAHPVEVRSFSMARAPVTQAEFAAFVEDGGYRRRELWGEAGWAWREAAGARQPVYWRREGQGPFLRRHFDAWVPLEPHQPVIHVNWHEADAYCRWAGRRLPTEAEWELAASAAGGGFGFAGSKRRFPWGDLPPGDDQANLDGLAGGCVDV